MKKGKILNNIRKKRFNIYRKNNVNINNKFYGTPSLKFNYNVGTSTFGPGSRFVNISSTVNLDCSSEQLVNMFSGCIDGKTEWVSVSNNFKYFKVIKLNITFLPRQIFVTDSLAPLYLLVNYDGARTPHIRVQDNVKIIPNNFFKYRTYSYKMANVNAFKRGWYTSQEMENFNNVLIQLFAPDNNKKFYIRFDVSMVCRGPTSPSENTIVRTISNSLENSLNSSQTSEQEDRKDREASHDKENNNKNIKNNNKNENNKKGSSCATNLFEVIPEFNDNLQNKQRVTQVSLDRLLQLYLLNLKINNKLKNNEEKEKSSPKINKKDKNNN